MMWSHNAIVPARALLHRFLTSWLPVRFSERHVT